MPAQRGDTPALHAVRQAFGLDRFKPVDYETARFGRFDPAVLAQARKRIAAATETWSALAGGDRNKLKPASRPVQSGVRFAASSCIPAASPGPGATQALDATTVRASRHGRDWPWKWPPRAVSQAAFEELDPADDQWRPGRPLAERLDSGARGAKPEPLEAWMEELYRRVSDNQTMGSVVDELRATLGEPEKSLDQFFRNPRTTAPGGVPTHLAQMRGVLSVLGLDQASLAVVRMRDIVERCWSTKSPEEDRHKRFREAGQQPGRSGLFDRHAQLPARHGQQAVSCTTKKGELRILMGQTRPPCLRCRAKVACQARGADDSAARVDAAVPGRGEPERAHRFWPRLPRCRTCRSRCLHAATAEQEPAALRPKSPLACPLRAKRCRPAPVPTAAPVAAAAAAASTSRTNCSRSFLKRPVRCRQRFGGHCRARG